MQAVLYNRVFGPEISSALIRMFFHSLWEGLAAALLAALILMFTKRSSPVLRYALLLGVFTLFILTSVATFCHVLNNPAGASLSSGVDTGINVGQHMVHGYGATVGIVDNDYHKGLYERLSVLLISYSSLIINIWFAIFLYRFLKLFYTLLLSYSIRGQQNEADTFWQKRLLHLAASIAITKPVILMESLFAKVPMTAGFLKPVILVPAGFFTGLSTEEAEAVLLHELAHIKRGDYLVNLVQCLTETVFFFNPGFLWLSSLIRMEREYCCDDIAIAHNFNKITYINALVTFQEYSLFGRTALNLSGEKGHLFRRVKRILTNDNGKLGAREKLVLIAGVAIMAIMLAALKPADTSPVHKITAVPGKKENMSVIPQSPKPLISPQPLVSPRSAVPVRPYAPPPLLQPSFRINTVPSREAIRENCIVMRKPDTVPKPVIRSGQTTNDSVKAEDIRKLQAQVRVLADSARQLTRRWVQENKKNLDTMTRQLRVEMNAMRESIRSSQEVLKRQLSKHKDSLHHMELDLNGNFNRKQLDSVINKAIAYSFKQLKEGSRELQHELFESSWFGQEDSQLLKRHQEKKIKVPRAPAPPKTRVIHEQHNRPEDD